MLRINQLKLPVEHTPGQLKKKIIKTLQIKENELKSYTVRKKSLDARKKPELYYVYSVDVSLAGEAAVLKRSKGNVQKAEKIRYRIPDYGKERMQILAELMRLRQICCEPSLCFEGYKGGSAKLDTCMELLLNGTSAGHKILLFSQFTSMLEIIAKRLKKEKIPFYLLTGSTPKRDRVQMASSFQKDDVMVFLISLKAGGTGLNLTAADVVIHYDPWWNVAAQNQATDRTHRIGQENQVSVFKLITKHTIEENILKLQEMKRDLADTVVTEGTGALSSITREDLIRMLDENV